MAAATWVFQVRKVQHRIPGHPEGGVVTDALENILHDWQTCHDFIEGNDFLEIKRILLPQNLNPHRSIDDQHRSPTSFPSTRCLPTHLGEIPLPRPRTPKVENPMRTSAAHKLFKRARNGRRIRFLAADSRRFVQKILVKHKICAFHAHSVATATSENQASRDVDVDHRVCSRGAGSRLELRLLPLERRELAEFAAA